MIIGHNLGALNALHYLNLNQHYMQRAMLRLSTGKRINSASDDPAGLQISQRMQAQINALNAAAKNSQDGISMLQTADGGLGETQSILQRMNELAVQAANSTNSSSDTIAIKNELTQLGAEINHIARSNNYNGVNLLSSSANITIQIGATSNTYDLLTMSLSSLNIGGSLSNIETGAGINIDTPDNAHALISVIGNALNYVSSARSTLGAYENRLNYTIDNLNCESENLTDAVSRITDADMAKEILNYSKYNILQQAAQAIFSQSLQQPDQVLKLLEGYKS